MVQKFQHPYALLPRAMKHDAYDNIMLLRINNLKAKNFAQLCSSAVDEGPLVYVTKLMMQKPASRENLHNK